MKGRMILYALMLLAVTPCAMAQVYSAVLHSASSFGPSTTCPAPCSPMPTHSGSCRHSSRGSFTRPPFREAFRPEYITAGLTLALAVYACLSHFGFPVFLVFGVIRGLDQSMPHVIVPMFIGALLGRFVFRKRFGDNWPQYRIVAVAGFSAGVGLITMLSLGFVFMTKSVFRLPF